MTINNRGRGKLMKNYFLALISLTIATWSVQAFAKDIVRDAEFYVLEAQHG